MPKFSAFTQFNMLKFSSAPSTGEKIYRSMVAAETKAFDLTKGTYQEAKVYAQAMGMARAKYALERAFNQRNPFKCIELLPQLELDWAVTPSETDTLFDRQAAVAARMILARGARREAIEAGLSAILGSHFLGLRAVKPVEAMTLTPSDQNFNRPDLAGEYIRLTMPVVQTGVPFEVTYSSVESTTQTMKVLKGDIVTIQPEVTGLREAVTVTAARDGAFTAVFTKSHDVGAFGTTGNYVDWLSTQRMLYVIVDAATASNVSYVRRVDSFMSKVCRGVTMWHVIEPTSPGATTSGPFTLNVSPLGSTSIGAMSLT